MSTHKTSPDLERLAAEQVFAYLKGVAVGSSLPVDSAAALCDILELLLPEVLRRERPEWRKESIDGFFFATAVKTGDMTADLTGTCILISDQTMTPFALSMCLSDRNGFRSFRIRLGERGTGPLGISGPVYGSRAAQDMLHGLDGRLEGVEWVYDVTVGSPP